MRVWRNSSRARLRVLWRNPCKCKSYYSHHFNMNYKDNVIIWDLGGVVVFVDESKIPFDYFSTNKDWINFENGKVSDAEFFNKYPKSEGEFNNIFKNNDFVINLIRELPKVHQYFFSNTNPRHFSFLQNSLDILKTSNVFLSYEMGLRKPDIESYYFVQQSLNAKNIYFIEDREKNLEIPKKMGWKTFLYHGNNEELAKFIYDIRP